MNLSEYFYRLWLIFAKAENRTMKNFHFHLTSNSSMRKWNSENNKGKPNAHEKIIVSDHWPQLSVCLLRSSLKQVVSRHTASSAHARCLSLVLILTCWNSSEETTFNWCPLWRSEQSVFLLLLFLIILPPPSIFLFKDFNIFLFLF